jgi:transposase
VTLQIVRDWVLKFNAQGPDGLIDRKPPGQPSRLTDDHRRHLAQMIEAGPIPAVHGVVRWRLIDLIQWLWDEHRVPISKQTLSREVRTLGYRKLSARPRHHAKSEAAVEDFKKPFPRVWRRSRPTRSMVSRSRSGLPMRRGLARRTRSPADGPNAALLHKGLRWRKHETGFGERVDRPLPNKGAIKTLSTAPPAGS